MRPPGAVPPWPPTRWRLPRATGSAPQFATAHARSGRLASQRKPTGDGRACLRPGSSWSVRQPKRNPGRRSMTSVLPRSTSPLMAPSCQRVSPATSVKEPPQQRCLSRPCAPALCRAAAAPPRRAGRRDKCCKLPSMLPLLSSPLEYFFSPVHSLGAVSHGPDRSGGFLWRWDPRLQRPSLRAGSNTRHPMLSASFDESRKACGRRPHLSDGFFDRPGNSTGRLHQHQGRRGDSAPQYCLRLFEDGSLR